MASTTFTPWTKNRSHRMFMVLSAEDAAKVRTGGVWSATVTNQDTGRRYEVEGAACGAGCHCAAIVVREVKTTRSAAWGTS